MEIVARASVCLAFEPSPRFVKSIVGWLTEFCSLTLQDSELVSRFHLAAYELVENVVKYATSDTHMYMCAEIGQLGAATILRVRTRNAADARKLARAVEILGGIKRAQDPTEYYDQLVRESAPLEGVSGLGLARIRAESELELDFEVEGNELSIVAQATVPYRAKAR